jgi:hypothetical protein
MLSKPDNKVLAALAALEGNSNFETVRAWLEQSRQDLYVESTETRDEVLTRWKQGAAQAVNEFLTKAQQAPEVIRRSR